MSLREQPVHAHWTEQPPPPGLNQRVPCTLPTAYPTELPCTARLT